MERKHFHTVITMHTVLLCLPVLAAHFFMPIYCPLTVADLDCRRGDLGEAEAQRDARCCTKVGCRDASTADLGVRKRRVPVLSSSDCAGSEADISAAQVVTHIRCGDG